MGSKLVELGEESTGYCYVIELLCHGDVMSWRCAIFGPLPLMGYWGGAARHGGS